MCVAGASLAIALGAGSAVAQPRGIPLRDLALAETLRGIAGPQRENVEEAAEPPTPFTARLALKTLRGYRATLSSLDSRDCQFYPSCSQYAENAVRRHGILAGSVMAFSRLQRCHPEAYRYYPLDETRGRLYDPVESEGEPPASDVITMPSPRNPVLAMSMSAALPGAGQVYSGRPWDGLYSLTQTALPATFSYLNYRRAGPSSVRGAAHAFLAAAFYVGGIRGAQQAAINRRIGPGAGVPVVNRLALTEQSISDPSSRYGAAIRQWAAGNAEAAAAGFRAVRRSAAPGLSERAAFLETLTLAELGRWNEAEEALRIFLEGCSDPHDRVAVSSALAFLADRQVHRDASARSARILSALLPGAGQIRAGKPLAAATSFTVNAVLGYYVCRTAQTESWGEFALFALPTFWRYYHGNISAAGQLAASCDDRRDYDELQRRLGVTPRGP